MDHVSSASSESQAPRAALRWWSDAPEESYWLESTDRTDIGANLKAPLLDSKQRENWRYCLFREANVGDVVYHYDKNARAIVGSSLIAGAPQAQRIEWVARGTSARGRGAVKEEVDGYSIPLTGTQWLDVPLTLEDLRASKSVLHDAEAAVQVTRRGAVYFPFELSQRPVRPLQGYAFKLPAQFVAAFPNLARSAAAKRVIRRPWSDAELAACLDVYMQLLERQAKRDHPNYANVIRCLAVELGRTPGAVDRRLQAISLLLSERKDKTVSRFPPGQSLTPGIRHRLSHLYDERTPTADPDALDRLTKSARERGSSSSPPAGSSDPSSWEKQQTRRFKRRADIRAWVLNVANGTCEACGSAAPFTGKDGYPFLEVHHLRPLAEGGPDTSCNAAAVCPNCHRRLHSGADNEAYRMLVVDGVDRLVDHPARPM